LLSLVKKNHPRVWKKDRERGKKKKNKTSDAGTVDGKNDFPMDKGGNKRYYGIGKKKARLLEL